MADTPTATPAAPASAPTTTFTRTPLGASPSFAVQGQPAVAPPAPRPAVESPAAPAKPAESAPPVAPVATGEPPKPDEVAARMAALQRRESQLVQLQKRTRAEQKQREAELASQRAELDSLRKELNDFKSARDAARADPLRWLQFGGHNYDEVAKQVLNDNKPAPEQMVAAVRTEAQEREEALRAELEKERQERTNALQKIEQQNAARARAEAEQTVRQFNQRIVNEVTAAEKDFPVTVKLGQQSQVPAYIQFHYQKTLAEDAQLAQLEGRQPRGIILSSQEAGKFVESLLAKQWDAYTEKLGYVRKPDEKPAVNPAAADTPPQPAQTQPSINNRVVASPSTPGEALSSKERWQRALAHLNAPGATRPGTR